MNPEPASESRADSSLHLDEALTDIEQALPRFARWMYRSVRDNLGKSVLDAGAGIGTHTELLLNDGHHVVALEGDSSFVGRLRERFAGVEHLDVYATDLAATNGLGDFPPVDSAICLNVLEHIVDDAQCLKNIAQKVRVNGTLVALVPAHPWLYNNFDRAIGHHRRYTRREFLKKLEGSGWTVKRIFYFNVFAIAGWFISGTVLRRTSPGRDLARFYDFLIPVLSRFENAVVRGKIGLSLIAVAKRVE